MPPLNSPAQATIITNASGQVMIPNCGSVSIGSPIPKAIAPASITDRLPHRPANSPITNAPIATVRPTPNPITLPGHWGNWLCKAAGTIPKNSRSPQPTAAPKPNSRTTSPHRIGPG